MCDIDATAMMNTGRDDFVRSIAPRYGWGETLRVTPQIGGYVAEVFLIETATQIGWLKCYDRQRAITQRVLADADFHLPVTHWLQHHSAITGRITAPYQTFDGQYMVDYGGRYVAVMFDYIVGRTLRESPLTPTQRTHLVTTVALMHGLTTQVPLPAHTVIEDFGAPWSRPLAQMLEGEWELFDADVRAELTPHRQMLQAMLVRFVQAGYLLRRHPPELVLCHTDIHGYNVIVNGDQTYLLDFEGLKLAPVEHDFMFWVDDAAWPEMLATYQQIRPGVVPDPHLIRFYQERRLLEDVYDYLEQLRYEQLTPELHAKVCDSLRQLLVGT
ncbi:MAG: phosphotransferase enzyme family protein [Roseiflexaceae bacterium]